jgi:hypothetical protein
VSAGDPHEPRQMDLIALVKQKQNLLGEMLV